MKSFIFTLLALTLFITQPVKADNTEPTYYQRWCQQVGSILRIAVKNSLMAQSLEEERDILLKGINNSLEVTPPKNSFYFLTTLSNIEEGLTNYNDLKDQVFFLRREARNALSDLEYMDQSFRSRLGDHREYVMQVIARALEEGERVKTDAQEIFVLNRATTISMGLLDDSNYRRSYACARQELDYVLMTENILIKRDHLRNTWRMLNRQGYCHF